MIAIHRWFERKFELNQPVWMFPVIVERLRGTPARLEDRVAGLTQNVLTRRDGDRWSVQEHVGHLGDLEPLHFKRIQEYLQGIEVMSPADLQNRKTHEAHHNIASLENLLDAFRTARMRMINVIEEFDADVIERVSLHPRLKTPMRLIDLCFFWAEHDDHHLAHVSALIRKFGKG